MTYREFKESVLCEIDKAESERTENTEAFDLRVAKHPYRTNTDFDTFSTSELWDVWNFVKDSREWYVDVYENIKDDDGFRHAEYSGFAVMGTEKDLLDRINDCNIYSLRKENGVQYIHMLGYYYDAEETMGIDDGKTWRGVEFGGIDMPLADYLALTTEQRELMESECQQWIADLTEGEVVECFLEDAPVELHYSDVTDDTPEGVYIAI